MNIFTNLCIILLLEDAECELNCRPKNQKYFARLGTVIDGTLCTKVSKNQIKYEYAVCVEGKCKVCQLIEKNVYFYQQKNINVIFID